MFSANKAYLQIPAAWISSAASKSVAVRFDDGETTAIDVVEDEGVANKDVYDLQGRKISEITAKCIYIIDGKRVLVK